MAGALELFGLPKLRKYFKVFGRRPFKFQAQVEAGSINHSYHANRQHIFTSLDAQDHLPKTTQVVGGEAGGHSASTQIEALDLESVTKAFQADTLKLSTDMSRFAEYEAKLSASQRQTAITKVLKMKSEQRRGSQLVVEWMGRNCKFVSGSFAEQHLNITEVGNGFQHFNLIPKP